MDLIANAPSIVDGGCFNQAMLIAMRVSSSNRCTHNQLGERFWGCRAPIIKFRRISNPAYTRRLAEQRNDYYAELAAASRGGLDITRWLTWFLTQFEEACRASEAVIDLSLAKARFWLEHGQAPLNARQRKAVNRILEAGPNGFEGGMSTDKYGNLARVSRATAYRDLEELVRYGLLTQAGVGRGTRYFAAMEGWETRHRG